MRLCLFYLVSFVLLPFLSVAQISFLENKGQFPSDVSFYADILGGGFFANKNGFVYTFAVDKEDEEALKPFYRGTSHPHAKEKIYDNYEVRFKNGAFVKSEGVGVLPGYSHFYTDDNPSLWAEYVRSFTSVYYSNVYRNIDLQVYSEHASLKYDFIVKPHAQHSDISLEFNGVKSLQILSDGSLSVKTKLNEVVELPPYAYQIDDITRELIEVKCTYSLHENVVKFAVGTYNPNDTLIIDPSLIFSTYTGATSDNWGSSATYDEDGNAYTSGVVDEGVLGYPVEDGKLQFVHGGGHSPLVWDVGVMKVSSDGKVKEYATYFGGDGDDSPHSMVVNSKNELIIFGTTGSTNMPGATNEFSKGPELNVGELNFPVGADMFVAKFDRNGALVNSTYLGGTANDGLNFHNRISRDLLRLGNDSLYYNYGDWARGEVILDEDDNVYIGCVTNSTDFPSSLNSSSGMMDGVVMKLSSNLDLYWSRYLGGDENDAIYSIDVDRKGSIYVTGGTSSKNLPASFNAFNKTYNGGNTDGFLAKLKNSGGQDALTYYGSSEYDQSYFVRADKDRSVYIYGQTKASDSELIFNADYNEPNSGQFIAKFDNDLSALTWSTVFGTGSGKPNISPTAFSVDLCNRVYLTGSGREWYDMVPNFEWDADKAMYKVLVEGTNGMEVTSDAFQSETDGMDFYIFVMYDDASDIDYATFFGEVKQGGYHFYYDPLSGGYYWGERDFCGDDHVDGGTSRLDREGNVYQSVCASCNRCQGFPVSPDPGAVSTTNNSGNCNNAVFKFNIHNQFLISKFKAYANPCADKTIVLENQSKEVGLIPPPSYSWDFDGDGVEDSNEKNPAPFTYSSYGEYKIRLIVSDRSSCNLIDTSYKRVEIKKLPNPELDTIKICAGDTAYLGFPEFDDPNFVYEWTPATYILEPILSNPKAIIDDDITYSIKASTDYCDLEFEQTVDVVGGNINPTFLVNGDANYGELCPNIEYTIEADDENSLISYEWSWDPSFTSIINENALDSVVSISLPESAHLYLQTVGEFCAGYSVDTLSLIVASANLEISVNEETVCKETPFMLQAVEIDGKDLDYEWSPAEVLSGGSTSSLAIAEIEKPTVFHVTATDDNGCTFTESLFIDVDSLELATSSLVDSISCYRFNDGVIRVRPAGVEPYSFAWSDGMSVDSVRRRLSPGIYTVTVTDDLLCENIIDFTVGEPEQIQFSYTKRDQSCDGVCNGHVTFEYAGGTPPLKLEQNGQEIEDELLDLCSQEIVAQVVDANGCIARHQVDVNLVINVPYVYANANPRVVVRGKTTELHAVHEFAEPRPDVEYKWSPADGLLQTVGAVVEAIPDSSMVYSLVATDEYGCSRKDTASVIVKEYICDHPFVYVPNAFSPNNDGENDQFQIFSKVLDEYSISVFNRWGQKVWESESLEESWDGTFNGNDLSPAVFDYYLKGKCYNGEEIELKGNINLIR